MTDLSSQAVLLGAMLGAFLMRLLMANRTKSACLAAVATATTGLQIEMAQAAEKVRSATAELESAREDARQKSQSLAVLQRTLDELKDEQARLTEQVPLVTCRGRSMGTAHCINLTRVQW
jgi:DNA recombination protein RmuC